MFQDFCFRSKNEDGTESFGIEYSSIGGICCTKERRLDSEEQVASFKVLIAPIDSMMLRSSCCCSYSGIVCNSTYNPLGFQVKLANLCNNCACGGQVVTGSIEKRGCFQNQCLCNIFSCEKDETNSTGDTCITGEISCDQMWLCCCAAGCTGKQSCCPYPLVICGLDYQCCCLYGKCHLPCSDAVPFEIGCCGGFCVDKAQEIKEYEEKMKELEDNDTVIEGVMVETAKSQTMQR